MIFILSLAGVVQAVEIGKSNALQKDGTEKSKIIQKGKSSKVEKFLGEIMKAKSLEEVSRAFERANFSEAEKKQIEKELKKSKYSSKLQSLGRKAEASAKAQAKAKIRQITRQKKEALNRKQEQELRRLNQHANTMFISLKRRSASAESTPMSRELTPAMEVKLSRSTLPGVGERPTWRIDSIEPQPVVVGGDIIISGVGFGTTQGRVDLLFMDTRRRYPLEIFRSWSQNRIIVLIPPELAPLIGESEKTVRLWVKPQGGGGLGPTREIRIIPDPTTLIPEITVLSSDSITPGQEIAISGRNFLTRRPGTVEFVFGSHRFRGIIKGWTNDLILAQLPGDITGLVTTRGQIEVENHAGQKATREIYFSPRTEIVVLEDREGHVCWGLLGHREYIQLWTNELINEWRVVDTERHFLRKTWRSGCSFEHRPEAGSTDSTTEIVVWCDAFNWVDCSISLVIEGPVGTLHGAGGRRSSPAPFR
jgi:hypothetical protein